MIKVFQDILKQTRKNTSRPNKKEIEIGEILQKVGIKCKFLQDIDYKTLENKPYCEEHCNIAYVDERELKKAKETQKQRIAA